ncbi:MAG: FG-GAP repeat protein [Alphaproteobacteria bacterium]|nr:FG-GAP repeat protein [Alphaproteobacteria bacterium]MCB9791759.1 FG-GAP repeat protein [Alphaproteobacteria bacterium]
MKTTRIAQLASLLLSLSAVGCTGEPSTDFPPTGNNGGGGEDELDGPSFTLTEPVTGQHFERDDAVWIRGTLDEIVASTGALDFEVLLDGEPVPDVELLWRGYDFSGSFVPTPGVHELSVGLSDEWGTTTHSVSIEVGGNSPPSTPEIAITPSAPVTGDELFLGYTARSVDPDGDAIVYDIRWQLNGEDQDPYRGLSVIPEGVIRRGERWSALVVASDGELISGEAQASVEVEGAGPVVEVQISPDPAYVDSELSCTWSAVDPDGEAIVSESARWRVNGVDAGDAASPLSGGFVRSDLVECVATARSTLEVTRTASLTVSNSLPVAETVTLLGAPATELDTLECSGSASDADGDAVTLVAYWYVDGANVGSGLTLDGADFDRDQEVWCALGGADSEAVGVTLESSHTVILNSAPTAPIVSLSPLTAEPGDTLTCSLDQAATDDDPNDTLSSAWSWDVNGAVDGSASGQTYDTSGLLGGERVTCTLEVSDGSVTVSDAASVIVGSRLEDELDVADADAVIEGSSTRAYLGATNAGLDDVDGDGVPDLLVGAYGYNSNRGAVFLFSGASLSGTLADTDATWWWEGDAANDYLSAERGFVPAGDIDGDGLSDAWLASWRATVGGDSETGAAYLLLSGDSAGWTPGASISTDAALVLRGDSASDRMGSALTAMDVDGDGVNDLLAGAPLDDDAATNAGQVAVLLTPSSGALRGTLSASDADYLVLGAADSDRLGYFGLQAVGDVDGDGNEDVLMGAATASSSSATEAGVAYLVSGAALADGDVEAIASARFDGLAEDDLFGIAAIGLGDLDGDGDAELIISARRGDNQVTDAGTLYLFEGGTGLSGTISAASADAMLGGGADGDRLGNFLATGDIDGDGALDLVTGSQAATVNGVSLAGIAWMLPGSGISAWPASGDVADYAQAWVQGGLTAEYMGRNGAVLGDINGDGAAEWVVGADGSRPNGVTRGGTVYIFGGP